VTIPRGRAGQVLAVMRVRLRRCGALDGGSHCGAAGGLREGKEWKEVTKALPGRTKLAMAARARKRFGLKHHDGTGAMPHRRRDAGQDWVKLANLRCGIA
jgi:hypothetical protein